MKREIYRKLLEWKSSPRRKPLLLKGARQTGKTYILKEFGKSEYERAFYFNFEEDPNLSDFFNGKLDPEQILQNLSLYQHYEIKPSSDLIIFDEIQASNNALNSLKYFYEAANQFHIVAAGSLVGVKLGSPKSFPVGKVNFLDLYPMTFYEFLMAVNASKYVEHLRQKRDLESLPDPIHGELENLLRSYYYVGGMPEAVKHYAETRDFAVIREIHREILRSYILDFAKHTPATDIPKLSLIWESIPSHLARENKKFVFSAVRPSARSREYENAVSWLEDAGLIYKSKLVSLASVPLKGYGTKNAFKIYSLDVGLLGAMANIHKEILIQGNELYTTYQGAFVENYVAQHLKSSLDIDLYYWKSDRGTAEIDFLYESKGKIYPLEVKAGINPKSKSLRSYHDRFHPPSLIRTTLLNFRQDEKICNIPLYAISSLSNLLPHH